MSDPLYPGATAVEARAIRQVAALAMDAPAKAKSGHSGTAMAMAPLGVTLFSRILRHDPAHPNWPDRDRFILSNGHSVILQYALAHTFGYELSIADIAAFRQLHSRTPGHPEVGVSPTVEVTTGPLGQGLANGVGMALAERVLRSQYGPELVDHRTWVIAGDGCIEEGISHEAASFAGFQRLDRLTVFYDDNHITIDGPTELSLGDDTAARFRAYGWHVVEVGERANDLETLADACRSAMAVTDRPTFIVVRSHIAYPSPTMMDTKEAHGNPFSAAAITEAKAILGVPDEPFHVDDEIRKELFAAHADGAAHQEWSARLANSGERGQRLLQQLETGGVNAAAPVADPYAAGESVSTRKAFGRGLTAVAPGADGLLAGAADLTENTFVTLPDTMTQGPTTPGGRQLHFGIREMGMGALLVGAAKHGGVRPICSTFFVFSDYQRAAVRLAAISHASVLFVYTHDSIGVGQDGPTHEPVEHLMSLRAMPNLHVVRPSDANETTALVHQLLTDPNMAPTALVLTRQDVAVMGGADAAASAANCHRGGYVVREATNADVTLISAGSEVPLCLGVADALAGAGRAARVVALPCWRCFDEQPVEYRSGVLLRTTRSIAVEAGATLGWTRYADEAIGIDSFGLSAPAPDIFEYFGLTVEGVTTQVLSRLG